MNKKYITGLIILIIITSYFFLKNKKEEIVPNNELKIMTSFYPLYFFTSEISGDKNKVLNITPSGAEPHEYEPTARDIANIEDSDLLVLNGSGLESWGDDIEKNLNKDKTAIIDISKLLSDKLIKKEGQEIIDPHIWLSPIIARLIVDKIENKLSEIDPDNASFYQLKAKDLKIKLDVLDKEFRKGLEICQNKEIVTSHAAFIYLAQAYNFNQISIAGLSPEEEPSQKQMADIIEFTKEHKIKYIFFESLASPKLSETIASEIGARTLILNPIEGLTEEEINSGKDYFSEMRNNLNNLKIALQCTP